MKTKTGLVGLTLVSGFMLGGIVHAAQPAKLTPEALLAACSGCHNASSGNMKVPALAGRTRVEIVGAMKDFRSGKRPSTVMGHIAKRYTDAELEAIGKFFSKQPSPGARQATPKS